MDRRSDFRAAKWAAALAVLIGITAPASGQDTDRAAAPAGAQAVLNAFACGALPVDYGLDVLVADDSKPMLRLRDALLKALAARGVRVSPNSPLQITLKLDTVSVRVEYEERTEGPARRREGEVGGRLSGGGGATPETLPPLPERHTVPRESAREEVHLTLQVHDKANGTCVWQGDAAFRRDGRDEWPIAEALIPKLVATLGKTVRSRPVPIE